jgi:ABC-type amino acid transport substrate-binding protein
MRRAILVLSMWLFQIDAQARPLVIVAEEYPPATMEDGGKVGGIDIEVAKAIFDRLGVPYEIKVMPWARSWELLKKGLADVGLHVSYTDDRAQYVHWPKNSVWRADFVFFTNKQTKKAFDFSSYDDVKRAPVMVGVTNANSYYPSFWDAFPSPDRLQQHYYPQLEAANDAPTNMRKLEANHIQLFPAPQIVGNYLIQELRLTNVTHYDWLLFSKPYPNAFSDKSDYRDAKYPNIHALMEAYDAELARIKGNEGEYQKFFLHYHVPYSDAAKISR